MASRIINSRNVPWQIIHLQEQNMTLKIMEDTCKASVFMNIGIIRKTGSIHET
jgi:hypothetical protein